MAKYKGRSVKLNKPMRGDGKSLRSLSEIEELVEFKKLTLVQRLCESRKTYQREKEVLWLVWVEFLERYVGRSL